MSRLREAVKRTPIRGVVLWWREKRQERLNRRLPSQAEKYRTIQQYALNSNVRTLVETGTNEGDAVLACLHDFDKIYSIELADVLYERASARFRDSVHVEIIHGDSSHVLPALVAAIEGTALFWLDGHYSGGITARGDQDTPILAELTAVLSRRSEDIILIDDARLFRGRDGYPSKARVRRLVHQSHPHARFEVANDIIRVLL